MDCMHPPSMACSTCMECDMSETTTPPAPGSDRRNMSDRRQGRDRRLAEAGPPTPYERRRTIEARQPEVAELDLSPDELEALGFKRARGDTAP